MGNGGLQADLLFSESGNVKKSTINKIKTNYSNNVQNLVCNNGASKELSSTGLTTALGSHSLQKLESTWDKVNGCTLDDIETRGCCHSAFKNGNTQTD
jgi:hypothetical protein